MGNVSGWTEGILLTLAFVAILGVTIGAMNAQYSQNHSVGFDSGIGTEQRFINYQDTSEQQIQGGDVEFDALQGISLKNSYGLATDAISIIWSFLSGGFIEQTINSWGLGASGNILAKTIRIIWFLSLVFALLYALFKVML